MPLTIDEMYAWVVVDDQGDEGVPAALGRSGMWMPLVGADRDRIESLRSYAEELAQASGKRLTLVRFSTREEVEVIDPPEAPERPQEPSQPCRPGLEHAAPCGPVLCLVDQVLGCREHGADEYCACGCAADESWCLAEAED